jgi:hypothetical protein
MRRKQRTRFIGPLKMVGTVVLYVEPVDGDLHGAGFVAHAKLSDGTFSWPMGADVYALKADAEKEAKLVKMDDGGPFIGQ